MPRVGLYFDLRNPPAWEVPWAQHYARALETMEQAEALGASALWLTEHHFFADGYLPQPLTMAAAVAARTTRVRIGTAVYLPLLRNPVQVAEEAAIVDILSGGRLDLGIGVGYQPAEFAAFGARMNRRFADLETHVGALRSAWAGPVTPKPVQSPLPLWGGFFGPRGARLAGRWISVSSPPSPTCSVPIEPGSPRPGMIRLVRACGLCRRSSWPMIRRPPGP